MPQGSPTTLAGSRSPFLRHGAEQPVAWLPWGAEAFERAQREGRPILLDIGAVWCHWCHVMDRESYEDPETAALINELFVPVKVDRDERPDVDARYQRAVQAVSGQGGWPLTAFLTPDGEVFYGGTYFPPEDRFGRPSFRRVLREAARVWREQPERAVEAARSIRVHVSAYAQAESEAGAVARRIVDDAVAAFSQAFDARHGGFGGAPKFPNAGALNLLLDRYLDAGVALARRIVTTTLTAMARGGIHDQLGGGFHRYATDERWLVPHFEKMAYDNGVLLEAYARAYAVFRDPLYRAVAEGIVGYYREVAPALFAAGGFPASQDADIGPHDDGDHWTWTLEEVRAALGGDERLERVAALRYGLDEVAATMPTDRSRHVLFLARDVDAVAGELGVDAEEAARLVAEVARRLKAARDARPRPFVDETPYSGWTALVASGHLAAARHFGDAEAGRAALRALDRIWEEAFDAVDGVAHRPGDATAGGYLEDQAYVAQALVDAFEWSQRPEHLERARRVAEIMLERFRAPGTGALADRAPEDGGEALLGEPYLPIIDAPAPAGNAVAALTLLRLAALVHDATYADRAREILAAFAGSAGQMPTAIATYVRAVDWATAPVTTVVVVGEPGAEAADALLRAALAAYRPRTVVRRFAPGAVAAEELPPALAAMVTGESPRAYLCAGQTCAAPVSEPDALAELLRAFRG
ncbi:MAG TPA: thioredoxin domain-containing protein [Longimicrobiales bacterium]